MGIPCPYIQIVFDIMTIGYVKPLVAEVLS